MVRGFLLRAEEIPRQTSAVSEGSRGSPSARSLNQNDGDMSLLGVSMATGGESDDDEPPMIVTQETRMAPAWLTGLKGNAHFSIRVAAISELGTGAFSESAEIVKTDPVPPQIPKGLRVVERHSDGFRVVWQASMDDGGSPVLQYNVRVKAMPGYRSGNLAVGEDCLWFHREAGPTKLKIKLMEAKGMDNGGVVFDRLSCRCEVLPPAAKPSDEVEGLGIGLFAAAKRQMDQLSRVCQTKDRPVRGCQTKVLPQADQPVWDETHLVFWHSGELLELSVSGVNDVGTRVTGKVTITGESFYPQPLDGWVPLEGIEGAALRVSITPMPTMQTSCFLSLNGLLGNSAHEIAVNAENAVGISECSLPIIAMTGPIAPDAPLQPPKATREREDSSKCLALSLRWPPPANDGGSPITGYEVRAVLVDDNIARVPEEEFDSVWENSAYLEASTVEPCCAASVGSESEMAFSLVSSAIYRFAVRAQNAQGWGPFTRPSPVVRTPDCPVAQLSPPQFHSATSRSITIQWQGTAEDAPAPAEEYEVCYATSTGSDATSPNQVCHTSSNGSDVTSPKQEKRRIRTVRTICRVSGLLPLTEYVFRVRARNSGGWSAWSGPCDPCSTTDICSKDEVKRALLRSYAGTLASLFRSLDRDGDSFVSREEFMVGIQQVTAGMSVPDEVRETLFNEADVNGQDCLSYREFSQYFSPYKSTPSIQRKLNPELTELRRKDMMQEIHANRPPKMREPAAHIGRIVQRLTSPRSPSFRELRRGRQASEGSICESSQQGTLSVETDCSPPASLGLMNARKSKVSSAFPYPELPHDREDFIADAEDCTSLYDVSDEEDDGSGGAIDGASSARRATSPVSRVRSRTPLSPGQAPAHQKISRMRSACSVASSSSTVAEVAAVATTRSLPAGLSSRGSGAHPSSSSSPRSTTRQSPFRSPSPTGLNPRVGRSATSPPRATSPSSPSRPSPFRSPSQKGSFVPLPPKRVRGGGGGGRIGSPSSSPVGSYRGESATAAAKALPKRTSSFGAIHSDKSRQHSSILDPSSPALSLGRFCSNRSLSMELGSPLISPSVASPSLQQTPSSPGPVSAFSWRNTVASPQQAARG
eukprot:TRINITY_DN27056_c0_g1_i1.p1 TRINITY_DN27056_c0_g1~~TRINITY_DN27056_c0_g1_i1.p1  ORF type:complete len:1278 (-),score=194.74 TRINITY_DN27056_c0_g1_i1:5-3304(-)